MKIIKDKTISVKNIMKLRNYLAGAYSQLGLYQNSLKTSNDKDWQKMERNDAKTDLNVTGFDQDLPVDPQNAKNDHTLVGRQLQILLNAKHGQMTEIPVR